MKWSDFCPGGVTAPIGGPAMNIALPGVNKHKYGWIFPPPYGTMAPTPQMRSRGRIEEMEKLCDLLGIRPGITALIGGGGKTTLMYHLARELRQCGTVAVTTTTRIWPPTGIAVAREPDAAREILDREGLVCLGVPSAQGKLVSPAFEGWDALADYTLVEADGSAGKPFKGHEKYEPVLPPRRNTTVLVLGADGFGRPISVAAHRPALYARLAGVPENRPVTPAIAARVAAWEGFHDQVFVNQVDREDEWPLARQLAEKLDCPVVAGSLRSGYWEKIK